jgi:hypothetical protein
MENINELFAQQGVKTKRLKLLYSQLKEQIQEKENCYDTFKQQLDTWKEFYEVHKIILNYKIKDPRLETHKYFLDDQFKSACPRKVKIGRVLGWPIPPKLSLNFLWVICIINA